MLSDRYPTRCDRPLSMMPRRDPIIHSSKNIRAQGPLSEYHLQCFERDGFLWFENLFSETPIMQGLLNNLASLEKLPGVPDSEQMIRDGETGSLRSVFGIHDISKEFEALTKEKLIVAMVRQILGSDVYIHQSRINAKPGFVGNGFNWHSDFETWHSEDGMPAMRALSVSLMLTENTSFNGPLMLVPGSHEYHVPCQGLTPSGNWKQSLKNQKFGVPDEDSLETLINNGGISAPTGGPGSLLIFDCNTLHASQKNLSPWPRANAFFVFNSVENGLEAPYAGTIPRPEFLASRGSVVDFPEPTSVNKRVV